MLDNAKPKKKPTKKKQIDHTGSTWFRLDSTLRDHTKPKRLAKALGIDRSTAIGHVVQLWCWACAHRPDGVLSDVDAEDLAEAARWKADPDDFLSALILVGFIDEAKYGLELHGFFERAKAHKRAAYMREYRARQRKTTRNVTDDDTRDVIRDVTRKENVTGNVTRARDRTGQDLTVLERDTDPEADASEKRSA